jgi:hypothetical protein
MKLLAIAAIKAKKVREGKKNEKKFLFIFLAIKKSPSSNEIKKALQATTKSILIILPASIRVVYNFSFCKYLESA